MHAQDLCKLLQQRFESHRHRHQGVEWDEVVLRLQAAPRALSALSAMESSGGEPDLIGVTDSGQFLYCDCSPESPSGRRSLCYDEQARDQRKANKPSGSALQMAATMGVSLLDEAQYHALQQLGDFDTKTSNWVLTPAELRARGGALFCDRRYGRVFTYHNGADSYFAARGFRALLRV